MRASRRLRAYIAGLVVSALLVALSCLALNCLVDPLWYLRGNLLTDINYPFNERLAKLIRLLPRLHDYDCVIFGTSRTTLMPADSAAGHHCYNLAFSDGQVGEYLPDARYLRQRGFAPSLIIVEIRRDDIVGPETPLEIPDFVRSGEAPPSLLASYLTLDALDFSVRTLRGDAPHHRYYDKNFDANLEVRSKKHWYRPDAAIAPAPPPYEVHPERVALYRQLREQFPAARAIAYVPPESAWRLAAVSLTPAFDPYLAALATIAPSYDRLLDFTLPSPITTSTSPADTYDGLHYSREVNRRVLATLLGDDAGDGLLDWHKTDPEAAAATLHRGLAKFIQAIAHRKLDASTASGAASGPHSD